MFVTKIKGVLAVVLLVATLASADGMIYQTQAAEPPKDAQKKAEEKPVPAQPTPQPAKTDRERMVGNWFIMNDDSQRKGEMWVITEDSILMYAKHGGINVNLYFHRLDAGQDPKQIDIAVKLTNGTPIGVIKGLYALDGDKLRLCLGEMGKDRPAAFPEKPKPGDVLVLQRASSGATPPTAKNAKTVTKLLTPDQIIRDKVEGPVRVEFTVGEYGQLLSPRRDATTPSVVVILEPKPVEGATYRLQVYVMEKVLARLGQLGIENLHSHLYGKVVRVSGSVKRVDYDKGGGYCYLVVENLDQFELIGAQPGSGTTPPENPVPPVIAVPGSGPTPPGTGPAVPSPGGAGPGLVTPGAELADEKKVLTPEQIFRDNFVGETRVEFTVGAVSFGGSPFDMEEATNRPRVATADGKFSVSRLRVIVAKKVEAHLKQLGIEDLRRHFYGKVVRVSGNLKQEVDAGGVGNRLITYSLTIESLDQLEFVGKK